MVENSTKIFRILPIFLLFSSYVILIKKTFLNLAVENMSNYIYIYIFRERGREGEREGNINVWLPLVHPY